MEEKDYKELILNSIAKIERSGMKLGLHRMKAVLEILGNPEKNLRVIHVAGTNGKGSVCAYLNSILSKRYKVGMYSSPGMIGFNDRIRVGEKFITYKKMYELYEYIIDKWKSSFPKSNDNLSFFEIFTVIAILYFVENNVDVTIFEVGLGGRFDATNIFDSKLVSVITKISKDHTNILGNKIEEIAYEKAGIIQKDDMVISYKQDINAEKVIKSVCEYNCANIRILDEDKLIIKDVNHKYTKFSYKKYNNICMKMLGEHQVYNAALAIEVADFLKKDKEININSEDIKTGIEATVWAGRLEWIKENVLLDGAHNVDGMKSLIDYIKKSKLKNLKFLLGILKDKDFSDMIKMLENIEATYYITKVPIDMKESNTEYIAKSFTKRKIIVIEDYKLALKEIIKNLSNDEILVVSGSLYLVSAIREEILENEI